MTNGVPAVEFLMTCNTECKILALMFYKPVSIPCSPLPYYFIAAVFNEILTSTGKCV